MAVSDSSDGLGPADVGVPRSNLVKRRLCALVADRVEANPALLESARVVLNDRLAHSAYRGSWQALIDEGVDATVAALRSNHDGLLADSPFALLGLVDERTRLQVLAEE